MKVQVSSAFSRIPMGVIVVGLVMMPALAAWGQAPQVSRQDGTRWSLGLGVISSPRPYVGADNQTTVIPFVGLEAGRFYLRGISAGYRLIDGGDFEVAVEARVQFAGFDEDDSPFLAGMEEREETVEIGVTATRRWRSLELGASVHADALGRSDGASAEIKLGRPFIIGRGSAGVTPWLGLSWHDGDFVDYYVGVRPPEARSDRPVYVGESAVNLQAGVRGFYRLAPKITMIALVQGELLADEFEDSPIIESGWGYFGLLGVNYSF